MKRVNHLRLAISLSLILFLLTVVAITISGDWSVRNIYLSIYFLFLNLTLFTLNALILSRRRKFVLEQIRKPLRIFFIMAYSLIYVSAVITFTTTGQIVRAQTLIFLTGSTTLQINILTLGAILVILGGVITLLHKKVNLSDSKEEDSRKLSIYFYVSLTFFIITLFTNTFFLQLENQIITDTDSLIEYQAEKLVLEDISKINQSFDKLNVVFILLESVSAERLGVYGYDRDVSPNIDKIANKGIRFDNAYTTATHSDYAQPGLLSSRYIFTNDFRTIFNQNNPRKFIWDIFKDEGYTTGYFSSQDDRWQSMDKYYDFENLDVYSYSLTDGLTDYGSGVAKKDYDHKTTEKAINWLNERDKEKPFFLYLNFQATHNPNAYPSENSYFKPDDGTPSIITNYDEKGVNKYNNALRYVDEQIGEVYSFLKENGLDNNTIIAITSDHGHDLENRHDIVGHGNSIYNEELVVPAIVSIPDVVPSVVEDDVSHIDFVPTLIDLLGYPIPDEFQGETMKKGRPIFFVAQSHKYKIGLVEGDAKIIVDMNKKLVEAYNLSEDPGELKNVNSENYEGQVLRLLFWRHCQVSYYDKEKWNRDKEDRCTDNNNFKILVDGPSYSPFSFFRD